MTLAGVKITLIFLVHSQNGVNSIPKVEWILLHWVLK